MESSVWVAPKLLNTKQTNKQKILACFLGKLAPLLDTKSNASVSLTMKALMPSASEERLQVWSCFWQNWACEFTQTTLRKIPCVEFKFHSSFLSSCFSLTSIEGKVKWEHSQVHRPSQLLHTKKLPNDKLLSDNLLLTSTINSYQNYNDNVLAVFILNDHHGWF